MSRGLGKIERSILEYLKKGYSETICILINVYYPERIDERGFWDNDHYTKAQYKSILRALASLERKGLVKSVKISVSLQWRTLTWYKLFALTNDSFPELKYSSISNKTYRKPIKC